MSIIYKLLTSIISRGAYEYEDTQNKLDVFYAVGRLTDEEYLELTAKIMPVIEETEEEEKETEEEEKETEEEEVVEPLI